MFTPAGVENEVSVAHGGTTIGPRAPVVAVTPVAAEASTRQNNGRPGLSARRSAKLVAVVSVSTTRYRNVASRAMRRR